MILLKNTIAFVYQALIILLVTLVVNTSHAKTSKNNLQLKLNDSISVYSEKAYKRKQGQLFEAIGNVVILNGANTLYGEKASLDLSTGTVVIEGNVRYISSDITVYGSKIDFNSVTREISIENARVITSDFNIVANSFKKTGDKNYHAVKAQFTTCQDCTESWSIYGEDIFIEIDQYVQIHHALAKIKGISVLYFPYVALPIKTVRESGLLFPRIYSTLNEGLAYEQPYFWNIAKNKDMTLTPRLLGKRGYGMDLEYRHVFSEKSWLNLTNRSINDSIYLPGKINSDASGDKFFRNFAHFEGHYQPTNNITSHLEVSRMKDFDMISDFSDYLENYIYDTDIGSRAFINYRGEDFYYGIDASYRRNMLFDDPRAFDREYIQQLPYISFSATPRILIQENNFFLQKLSYGLNGSLARFAQRTPNELTTIKNATRLSVDPYIDWHLFDIGPTHFKTQYNFSNQIYRFSEQDDDKFTKGAHIFRTQASFSLDNIFGAAKVERVKRSSESFLEDKESNVLIGKLPSLNTNEDLDFELIYSNSYRHTQEFYFIHHYISSSYESGSQQFLDQIKDDAFWFDSEDALKRDLAQSGLNDARTDIPVLNTFEFQWNNTLVRKSPNADSKYKFEKIGYFDISQGVLLKSGDYKKIKDRLTRLYVSTGYQVNNLRLSLKDYYFHNSSNHKLEINAENKFKYLSFLTGYNYNSIDDTSVETVKVGVRTIPIDFLGLSFLQDYDLNSGESIRREYQVDLMPDNNCWIFNINYRKNVIDERFSLNFVFNFGSADFASFRNDYFRFN